MDQVLRHLDAESDAEYELESEEGSLFSGSVLFIGIMTMMWAGIVFSYFYLRELDRGAIWRPGGLRPPELLGALIGLMVVIGLILFSFAVHRLHQGMAFEWEFAAWLAVGCGCVGIGLQVWELTRLPFQPGTSGYTSVFVGFAILNIAFIFSGTLWAEFVAARGLRLRWKYDPETYLGVSVLPEVRVWRASLRGCLYYWWFMAIMTIFFWVLFYVL